MSQKTKILTILICLVLTPLVSATMNYQKWEGNVGGRQRQLILDFLEDPINPVPIPDAEEIIEESLYRGDTDNYVAKAYGWLTVPETGDYQFVWSSDDTGMLYVSPDEDMVNAVEVAYIPDDGWAGNAQWDKYPEQVSEVMSLKKGDLLAVMAFYEEAGGGDNMDIGWTGPGLSDDVANPTYLTDYITHIAPVLTKARYPSPAVEATDVLRDTLLSWTPGEYPGTHNVYLGTSLEEVDAATVPTGTSDVNSFDPSRLEFDQTYYWRVDEVNTSPDKTVYKGKVWSFTVEPYSIMIPGSEIVVTASSSSTEFSLPEKLVDGSGLSEDGAHDIVPESMWFTGTVDLDPWIQFEFDAVKKLDMLTVWNSNGAAEAAIGWGVKDVIIEYSEDGENWTVLEGVSQFTRAPGLVTYDTPDEIALNGVPAKYVRFDIESNWGGILMSYGLSEVQFTMIPAQAREPDPASGATGVLPSDTVAWRAGREADTHTVYISTDANAVADGTAPAVSTTTNSLDLSTVDLDLGETYYWRVDEVNEAETTTVWEGPVWNLSLAPAVAVDDFEGYNNLSPDRPFQTWLDGFGYSADEFFPQGYGGNGTGAGIGHDIWTLTSPHYDGDIMETAKTLNGSDQALPFYFEGDSETQRAFAPAQNWTLGGVTTLVVGVRGNLELGAADQLYLKINDTKVPYDGDLSVPIYKQWEVDLASLGIDVSNITSMSFGVEGTGSGMILLDDILLYKTAPTEVEPPAGSDMSLVAHWTLDETEGLVAADSSGYGNHGDLIGMDGTEWVAGISGGALMLDGSQYVDFGNPESLQLTDAVTIAAWAKMEAGNEDTYMGIAGKMGDNTGANRGFVLVRHTNNLFRFWLVTDGTFAPAESDVTYNDTDWHRLVGVVSNGTASLYVDGVKQAVEAEGELQDSGGIANIGRQYDDSSDDRLWNGLIDDVRIYYRALSEEEIANL